ncbi:MAG TPA: hypothetical protein VFW63_11730, partial [Acidimicrobiales bacterium]|nr:hypothetical protein [Acidimicrobiales bacterium]
MSASRWAAGLVAAAGWPFLLAHVLGPWPAAVVLAPTFVVTIILGWASLERRIFDAPPPPERWAPPVRARVDPEADPHVEFARGLRGVATWYLDECTAERDATDGPGRL